MTKKLDIELLYSSRDWCFYHVDTDHETISIAKYRT